jgi:hypothetical protein
MQNGVAATKPTQFEPRSSAERNQRQKDEWQKNAFASNLSALIFLSTDCGIENLKSEMHDSVFHQRSIRG